jgi:hypothetical protein
MTAHKTVIMGGLVTFFMTPAHAGDFEEARWSAYGIGMAIYAYEACGRDSDARALRDGFSRLLDGSSLTRPQRNALISMHSDGYRVVKGMVAKESETSMQATCQSLDERLDSGVEYLLAQFSTTL